MRKIVDLPNKGGLMMLAPFLVFVNGNVVAADSSKVYSSSVLNYNAVKLISKAQKPTSQLENHQRVWLLLITLI